MSTNRLSVYRQKISHQFAELYSNLMPIPCLLCGGNSQKNCLCNACITNLPKLGIVCPRCATPLSHATSCGQCLQSAPEQNSSFCLYRYQSPLDRLIADMKYHDKLFLTDFFARQMAIQITNRPLPELLIPIPLHNRRLRQRGFNQSLELAKSLSKHLKIPVRNDILKRIRDTVPQTSLPFSRRKNNMAHAFSVNNITVPTHIALIDDVLTTGHTANVAAKIMRQAGAHNIELWTIARTIRHD